MTRNIAAKLAWLLTAAIAFAIVSPGSSVYAQNAAESPARASREGPGAATQIAQATTGTPAPSSARDEAEQETEAEAQQRRERIAAFLAVKIIQQGRNVPDGDGSDQAGEPSEQNVAEAPTNSASDDQAEPIRAGQAVPDEIANAAESRPAGTSLANNADNSVDENGVAIPPEPPFTLPTPAEVAGSSDSYEEPTIELDVPGLEPPPPGSNPEDYSQPERGYLDNRPLPGIDEDETEEERIYRNIEESLKQIDLTKEQRPDEGIQIPLPSGVVTFKASDSFSFDRRNRILTFRGDAEIIFEDIAIWADLIEVHDGAAMAYASGYVALQNNDEILYCDEAYLNYDTQVLELFWVEGNTGGPRLNGTLYFQADRAHGTFDELILEHAEITTCEPFCGDVEEVHFSARKVVYKREKSIILHDIHPYVRSHKVGWLPILAFPLTRELEYTEEESEIDQTYGYNRSAGMFAKFAYTYSARYTENVNRALLGVVKLELTQKQGPGLGIRQDIYIPSMGVGTVRAYYQEEWPWSVATFDDGSRADPQQNFEFELTQELNLSRELTGDLSIKRKNQIVPATNINGRDRRTNTWDSRFNLNYRRNKTTASLTASQRINIQGGVTGTDGTQEPERVVTNSDANFRFNRDLSKQLKLAVSQSYSAQKGSAGRENLPADQEGTFQIDLDWRGEQDTELEGYQAQLTYLERGIDYDGDANTTDRNLQVRKELPSLEITLPRDLINDGAYFTNFRVDLQNLVTGRRSSPESSFKGAVVAGGQDTMQFSRSSRLTSNSTFEQDWYDDGNAQYVIQQRLNYTYDTFDWMKFDAGWNLTYHQGVENPPVQNDRRTYQQRANYGFTFTNGRSWRWRLRGGYDFERWRHSPVTSTFDWDPNRTFGMTNTFSYDIVNRKINPLRTVGYFHSPYVNPEGYYNWIVNFTVDTDIEHNWRTTRFDVKWAKRFERGWSGEITGSFRDGRDEPVLKSDRYGNLEGFGNDFIKKIAVRKVNCCTTIEGGWRTGINEIYVNVYLNALPQYPGTADFRRPLDDEGSYDFLFPVRSLQQDILRDMFGINQNLFF